MARAVPRPVAEKRLIDEARDRLVSLYGCNEHAAYLAMMKQASSLQMKLVDLARQVRTRHKPHTLLGKYVAYIKRD